MSMTTTVSSEEVAVQWRRVSVDVIGSDGGEPRKSEHFAGGGLGSANYARRKDRCRPSFAGPFFPSLVKTTKKTRGRPRGVARFFWFCLSLHTTSVFAPNYSPPE